MTKPFGTRPMTLDELSFILSTTHGNWKVFVGDNANVVFNVRCKSNYVYLCTTTSVADGLTAEALRELVDQEYEAMRINPDGVIKTDPDLREVFADEKGTVPVTDFILNRNDKTLTILTGEFK